jgi:uncharacterized protein DUF4326
MVKPVRLTRSRAKGSRLTSPNGLPVACVTRGTKWGNPIKLQLQADKGRLLSVAAADAKIKERRQVLEMFRNQLLGSQLEPWASMRAALPELRGKNLACWCAQGDECHADVLLEVANG